MCKIFFSLFLLQFLNIYPSEPTSVDKKKLSLRQKKPIYKESKDNKNQMTSTEEKTFEKKLSAKDKTPGIRNKKNAPDEDSQESEPKSVDKKRAIHQNEKKPIYKEPKDNNKQITSAEDKTFGKRLSTKDKTPGIRNKKNTPDSNFQESEPKSVNKKKAIHQNDGIKIRE